MLARKLATKTTHKDAQQEKKWLKKHYKEETNSMLE